MPAALGAAGAASAAPGDILVADHPDLHSQGSQVMRVKQDSGRRDTVSNNGDPAGLPEFARVYGIAAAAGREIVVTDIGPVNRAGAAVIAVHPVSGVRRLISANHSPPGEPQLALPTGVAYEADGDILVADARAFDGNGGIIRVDPVTGVRTTVSANGSPPGGPDFREPKKLAIEADGDILVLDSEAFGFPFGGVIRVDPVTGQRTALSSNADPTGGPSFGGSPYGAIAVAPNGDVLVTGGLHLGRAGGRPAPRRSLA